MPLSLSLFGFLLIQTRLVADAPLQKFVISLERGLRPVLVHTLCNAHLEVASGIELVVLNALNLTLELGPCEICSTLQGRITPAIFDHDGLALRGLRLTISLADGDALPVLRRRLQSLEPRAVSPRYFLCAI